MRKVMFTVIPVFVLAFAATSTGCGKNKWLKRIDEIKSQACSCKDVKCAEDAQRKFIKFSQDGSGKKVAKSTAKKIKKTMRKTSVCLAKWQGKMIKRALKKGFKKSHKGLNKDLKALKKAVKKVEKKIEKKEAKKAE